MKKHLFSHTNKKRYTLQKGFTLVEILAVIVVFIVIGSVATATFFTSLRTVNKSNSLASLRENGNYTLNQVTKTIRYAVKFEGVSNTGLDADYQTNCSVAPVKGSPYSYLRIRSYDNQRTTLQCSVGPNGNISSNSASLLDPGIVKTVDACSFSCSQENAWDPPTILINLTLSETGFSGINEKNTTLPLQTSVTFRNPVSE